MREAKRTMKIMFINASLTDGGSERAMTLIANQLARLGHDVSMLLIREKERTYEIDPGINLIQLRYPSKSKIRILPRRLRLIRKHAKAIRPDCVVSFMWEVNVMALMATVGLKSRKVISERAYPGSSHRSKVSRLVEDIAYGLADVIVYQTEGAREFCPRRLKSRSVVIPNIVAKPKIAPFSGERTKRVVSVGRLTEQKNFPMLLDAFAAFSKQHPDYVLEIYGEGELRGSLEELAHRLGVSGVTKFMGYVSNVSEAICDASMFVLPSNYEGISNAMSEAMALGLPTICTDCPVGGAAMMIDDGVNGLLIPVGDAKALEQAMNRVVRNKDFSDQISAAARNVAVQYSADLIAKRWESTIE